MIIEPRGGLGNQLFIYAVGREVAHRLGTDLVCDTWHYHNFPSHSYELDTFSNSISQTFSSRSREIFGHASRRILYSLSRNGLLGNRVGRLFLEQHSYFSPSVFAIRDGVRLDGYFQSPKYFLGVADLVRDELHHLRCTSPWMLNTEQELASLGSWTAVHVRRGDYMRIPSMGLVGNDYYARAVNLLDSLQGIQPIALFSDSPEQLGGLLDLWGDRVHVVVPPDSVRPLEILTIMSQASALVIGNSTFSWWAAFLRHRQGRAVIAPRPWLSDAKFVERDLFPPEWISIGHG